MLYITIPNRIQFTLKKKVTDCIITYVGICNYKNRTFSLIFEIESYQLNSVCDLTAAKYTVMIWPVNIYISHPQWHKLRP